VHWDELLRHIEHRLGMSVGQARYDRALALVTGFDLARDRGDATVGGEMIDLSAVTSIVAALGGVVLGPGYLDAPSSGYSEKRDARLRWRRKRPHTSSFSQR
jgi:hypothetical protein